MNPPRTLDDVSNLLDDQPIAELVHWLVREHGQELLPGTRVTVKPTPAGRAPLWADGRAGTVRGLSDLTDFGTLDAPRVDVWYEVDVDDSSSPHPQTFSFDELLIGS